jgi:hypothetical protein
MSTIDRSRIAELMQQAEGLERGPTQVGLLEEAVRLADLLVDLDLAFETRSTLIDAASFSGSPEKALVAFSWCLARIDREPGRFPEHDMLWRYKWVINSLPTFPQIHRPQIDSAVADMTRRIERVGSGMQPVYKVRFKIAGKMGDLAEHQAAHDLWADSARSDLSDCLACDRDDEVRYLINLGCDAEAVAHARPILDGAQRCAVVPHNTLAWVLLPLVRLGRVAEAVPCHLKGYRLIARNRDFFAESSQHLQFLALTDNLAKGMKLFETHLPWALDTFDLLDRFQFSLSSSFLFQRLGESGKDTVRLRLPESFPGHQASGRYALADLAAWLDSDAEGLARRFDERNGNDFFARKIEASRGWHDLVTPFSVAKPRKSKADPAA